MSSEDPGTIASQSPIIDGTCRYCGAQDPMDRAGQPRWRLRLHRGARGAASAV